MVGLARLDQVQQAVENVLADDVPGDLIETGVWRGGTCILMRAVLAAHDEPGRTVWVADSFEGSPPPDPDLPHDAGTELHKVDTSRSRWSRSRPTSGVTACSMSRSRFLPGYFRETLPVAPIERLAVLRLDGDLYESTMIALESLYPKLSPGGLQSLMTTRCPPAVRPSMTSAPSTRSPSRWRR